MNLSERNLRIGPLSIQLPPIQYAIYYFMADRKVNECRMAGEEKCGKCTKCFVTVNEITEKENLDKILTFYKSLFGSGALHAEKMQERFNEQPVGFMESFRGYFTKVNRLINYYFEEGGEQYKISSSGGYGSRRHGIRIDKSLIILKD